MPAWPNMQTLSHAVPGSPGSEPPLALVTGASSGIGLEFARLLARDGFRLILLARDNRRLAAAARAIAPVPGGIELMAVDLSDREAVEDLCGRLAALELDVLVNNAGFGAYGPFDEIDGALEADMIAANVTALTLITKAVLPGMVARGQGRIVNVASTAAFAPGPFAAVYSATKAYVLSLSEALAEELRDTRIRVTALCPGPTDTAFVERAGMGRTRVFKGPVASAKMVAEAGYAAMLSGRPVAVVGLANRLMTFAVRFAPRALVARLARRAFAEDEIG
ncbi:SDR family NAD(P)-dependent oxidoreductase [Aquabacter sp. L1I39]|uniref:SDR family NAD(P)-dependent oxidoreductase n=1 Tax=Aquabacter sp. L1I39 TaxID=2820278 RepID=UPI001ADCC40E|nr:SDR family NAD(P)-dependent oxidoreductase [Aquabacter sp. L1I39]QTL02339.1 SDR family NAD(P)-dependent oxidoreductase [Aquabacter sp. L1I39]